MCPDSRSPSADRLPAQQELLQVDGDRGLLPRRPRQRRLWSRIGQRRNIGLRIGIAGKRWLHGPWRFLRRFLDRRHMRLGRLGRTGRHRHWRRIRKRRRGGLSGDCHSGGTLVARCSSHLTPRITVGKSLMGVSGLGSHRCCTLLPLLALLDARPAIRSASSADRLDGRSPCYPTGTLPEREVFQGLETREAGTLQRCEALRA